MSLTKELIIHELENWGKIVDGCSSARPFEDVRLFFGTRLLQRKDVLYITDDPKVPSQPECADYSFLFVNEHTSKSCEGATVSLVGSELGSSAVLTVLQDLFLKYRLWEQSMDQAVASGSDIQRLIDLAEGILPNHFVIVDAALKLRAESKNVECDDPITIELLKHGYHTEDSISKFKLNQRFKPWSTEEGFIINDTRKICKYTTAVYSFKVGDSFSLILVMMCNQKEPEQYLLDAVKMLANRIEVYAKNEYSEIMPSGNVVDSFLKDLALGLIEDEEAIRERSEYAGIPYSARFCMFAIPVDFETVPVSRILSDLASVAAPAKTLLVESNIVILCFNCITHTSCRNGCLKEQCPRKQRTLSVRLDEALCRHGLQCGRSSSFSTLADARTAYLQATVAARIGARERHLSKENAAPDILLDSTARGYTRKMIHSFEHYSMFYLAEHVPEESEALFKMTFSHMVLEEIANKDIESGMDNYEFLFTYLVHERRASVVAELMNMHRNNVKYRIDKIESTFGIDTANPSQRFALMTAFRIRKALFMKDNLH